MAGEIAFLELGVQDTARGRAFYEALFGWDFRPGPGQGLEISGLNVPGGLHGGDPGAGPYVFFRVDDLESALERVRALGGSVDEPDIEGDEESRTRYGRFKLCRDNQGSLFGLHVPPR
ncbi:VOC family protein [Streptomyces sp. ACA25]|uniref:VOC family protein n=1 Tax=Streptomyces sp. ACA25 TaxID=3022596 RepID=UPI0023075557|nr:VOC family protein [Streptomyces sp. ACA25]MDB1088973.1 VOC family protein [Streptomyces sp. ACA25]